MNEWRQEVITSGQALSVSQGLEKRVPPPLPYRAKAPPPPSVPVPVYMGDGAGVLVDGTKLRTITD